MKKVLFLIGLFIFLAQVKVVYAEESNECVPDNHPTINNTHDLYYVIGDDKPDYKDGITVTNSCGNADNILTYSDDAVKYDQEGSYELYYYSHESVATIEVYVYESIPDFNGLEDFTVEVNSETIDYLNGITATDVYDSSDLTADIQVDDTDIDYTKVGDYDLKYTVTDHHENTAIRMVKVNVQDTTKPVIQNYKDLTLQVHQDLSHVNFWDGIEVTDNSEDTIDKQMNKEALNIDVIGTYTITYQAIDQSGNETDVNVLVHVVDNESPILDHVNDIELLLDTPLNDALFKNNVSIEDNYDGNISTDSLIVDYHHVDSSKPGTYPVMYYVVDSSGNSTIKVVNVHVYDEDKPVINNTQDINVSLGSDPIDYLDGITCEDETDGNLIDQLIVYDDVVNLNKVGTYPVKYVVMDSSGNTVEKTIHVTVYDDERPQIIGTKDLNKEVNGTYTADDFLQGVTATDNSDGDLTSSIEVDFSNVDFTTLGDYEITYTVSDLSGNKTEVTVTVSVVDTTPPEITGFHDLTIEMGNSLTNEDILALFTNLKAIDNYDGDLTSEIYIDGFYDSEKAKTYPIRLLVSDANGNQAKETFNLKVVSKDTNSKKSNYNIYYIIGGMGLALVITGYLGYKTRRFK